jgi:hypothetical protein
VTRGAAGALRFTFNQIHRERTTGAFVRYNAVHDRGNTEVL